MKRIVCFLLCMALIGVLPVFADETNSFALREVYQPDTKIILPPTVVETLKTAQQLTDLQVDETPPQALQFALNENNKVSLEEVEIELSQVLDVCAGNILPVIELNENGGEWLASLLKQRAESDLFVVSRNESLLKAFMDYKLPCVYGIYKANVLDDMETVAKKAHSAKANTVLFSSIHQISSQQVRALQSRFLTVFLDGSVVNDSFSVRQAIDTGADGVVVTQAQVAYDLYAVPAKGSYTRRPLVVGHRGFPTTAPENTVEGMKAAFDAGADAVECDVYLTADNHVVINHDGNLSGYTTDSSATASVESLTREQLKNYTLKTVGEYSECKIAFLDEMFQVLKNYPQKMLVIEIKTGNSAVAQRIYDLANEYGVLDQIVIISYIAAQLEVCRQVMPEIGTSLLFTPSGDANTVIQNTLNAISTLPAFASPQGGSMTALMREMLYCRGIACNVWTIDGTVALKNQVRYGAMHLTTNNVNLAAEVRDALTVSTSDDFWGAADYTIPVFGDVNSDTKVDASDALMVLKSAVGKQELTEYQTVIADVDGDNAINAVDALYILKKAVGKIAAFPVQQ